MISLIILISLRLMKEGEDQFNMIKEIKMIVDQTQSKAIILALEGSTTMRTPSLPG